MHAGLVPVITRETGIDEEDFGVLFGGDELEDVERTVLGAVDREPEWVRERAAGARRAAWPGIPSARSSRAGERSWRR